MEIYNKGDFRPYAKGRWFKVFCETDNNVAKITTTEIDECMIDSNRLMIPHDLHIVDVLCDFNNVEFDTGTANINNVWYALPNGTKYILLPNVKSWDYGDVWIFGYRTEVV